MKKIKFKVCLFIKISALILSIFFVSNNAVSVYAINSEFWPAMRITEDIKISLDKEDYKMGETVWIKIELVNSSGSLEAKFKLILERFHVASKVSGYGHGEEVSVIKEDLLTLKSGERKTTSVQYTIPNNLLFDESIYYITCFWGEKCNSVMIPIQADLEAKVNLPSYFVEGNDTPAVLILTNISDKTINNIQVEYVENPSIILVNKSQKIQVIPEMKAHTKRELAYLFQAVYRAQELGEMTFNLTTSNSGKLVVRNWFQTQKGNKIDLAFIEGPGGKAWKGPFILRSPSRPTVLGKYSIDATITNYGYKEAQNVKVQFLIDGKVYEEETIGVIKPNEVKDVLFHWEKPTLGRYTFEVKIDPDNTIEETNETNNTYTWSEETAQGPVP